VSKFGVVMKPRKVVPLPEPECGRTDLVSTKWVQKFLGVSRSTLMRLVAARKIEAVKMDGGWRFRWEAVERFVQRRTRKAA
jgi:excisionase family DNA binding protein